MICFGGKALAGHLGLLLARVEFSLSTWTRNNRSRQNLDSSSIPRCYRTQTSRKHRTIDDGVLAMYELADTNPNLHCLGVAAHDASSAGASSVETVWLSAGKKQSSELRKSQ